jgi:hypothetical protein
MKNRLEGSLFETIEEMQKEVISAVGQNGEIHNHLKEGITFKKIAAVWNKM